MARSTTIDSYLAEISRYPLLTAQEEIELGRQVQEMMQLRELERELTPQEKRAVKRGERAQQKFVRANLKLVVSAAKRYLHVVKNMDLMDLVQEGNLGLIRGVEKYDPTRGYKFSTYAYWWIRQSINRAIATKERAVRLPGKAQEFAASWNVAYKSLQEDLGRAPKIAEIAEYFGVPLKEIEHFMRVGMSPTLSLDQMLRDESSMSFGDTVEDPNNLNGADALNQAIKEEYALQLQSAFGALTERERELIVRKWGLEGRPPETLNEIGNTMNISRERVRQLLEKTHRKLRLHMTTARKTSPYSLPVVQEKKAAPPRVPVGAFY